VILVPWLLSNASWLIPACGWVYSEYLGWKSGGKKASVSQIIWAAIQEFFILLKDKFG